MKVSKLKQYGQQRTQNWNIKGLKFTKTKQQQQKQQQTKSKNKNGTLI